MRIKLGKKYVLRNGRITKKLVLNESNMAVDFPLQDPKTGYTFTLNGSWCFLTGKNCSFDIVSRYKKKMKI
jgi:hypothetical protein